jgi:hypothetical protein
MSTTLPISDNLNAIQNAPSEFIRSLAMVVPNRSRRVAVPLVENRDGVSDVAQRIAQAKGQYNRFLDQAGSLVFVRAGLSLIPLTRLNLNGILSSFLELAQRRDEDGTLTFKKLGMLPSEQIGVFLHSPTMLAAFSEI